MSMMEMFWTWKVKLTPTQMCHRSICHDFPLLWCSTGHETYFSGTIKQIEIQTTDNCSNTALSTRQMTPVQVKSNCSWNPILCYRPIKGSETQSAGITRLCCVCLTSHPKHISNHPERTEQKMVPARDFLCWGRGNTTFPYFSSCDKSPNMWHNTTYIW